jgi:hypothetical protein
VAAIAGQYFDFGAPPKSGSQSDPGSAQTQLPDPNDIRDAG